MIRFYFRWRIPCRLVAMLLALLSNCQIPKMIHAGLLRKLDHARIPNLKNLLPKLVDPPFDRGKCAMAYQWGATGHHLRCRQDRGCAPELGADART